MGGSTQGRQAYFRDWTPKPVAVMAVFCMNQTNAIATRVI